MPAALAPRMARLRMRTVLFGARPAVKMVGEHCDVRVGPGLGMLTAD